MKGTECIDYFIYHLIYIKLIKGEGDRMSAV